MSKASVEQALTGLVPALNGPLPPELVQLTLSLLARSRSVASSLKSDEEIARPYACAQLACERSKKRFNLPAIVSRPPCPPRIYKKLYNYLSSALPANDATRDPQTPSKKTASAPVSARTTPKTPASGRRTPRSTRKQDAAVADVPVWVMPAVRSVLKKHDIPSAAPHIYTGVESILPLMARMSEAVAETPSKRRQRTTAAVKGVTTTRILALVAVVFLYVYTKIKDVEVTPDEYEELRKTTVNTLLDVPVAKDVAEEDLSFELQDLMDLAQGEGWLQMEWFLNIVPAEIEDEMEGVEATGTASRNGAMTSSMARSGGSDYIGLGTMMQDATDYLGERQREDYKMWKAEIMARVQEIEAQ